jgi:sugar/nucleoside kinase (ribokinase family)
MTLDIMTYGDLVADALLAIPSLPLFPNREQIAHDMHTEPGGMANFLIMASRLGGNVAPVGVLGDDPYGRMIQASLEAEGVDISGLTAIQGKQTTLILVLVSDAGEHVFVGVLGTARVGREALQAAAEKLHGAKAYYTNGYTFLETEPPELVVETMRRARGEAMLVGFDPGPQVQFLERSLMVSAVSAADVLFATAEEAALLSGEEDPDRAAAALLAWGPELVVIKRGVAGCLIASRQGCLELPGFPVEVRDTAGAGDAFDAAFLLARIRGLTLQEAGNLANAVGAVAVTRIGAGRELPSRDEVFALLAKQGVVVNLTV